MRMLLALFRSRTLIGILGLLCIAIVVWVWGPKIAVDNYYPLESELHRYALIAGCCLFWLINNIRLGLRVRGFQQAFVNKEPVAEDPDQLRSAEEFEQIQQRFENALNMLKGSKGYIRSSGLYDLPWYIVIGPPGSGKTTALVNSGLKFPLESELGRSSLKGVGGTRNCDWWFTDEAILIDTAGRYTTQDSHQQIDRSAWQGFLKLLKKYRPRQPINGAIVAISVADLLQSNESKRAEQLQNIRQRLHELQSQLGIRFPVYIVLTKTDLLSGFTEFFDHFDDAERDQVWGFTLPVGFNTQDHSFARSIESEFDNLLNRLSQGIVPNIHLENGSDQKIKMFAFTQQLCNLKKPLIQFIEGIFGADRFHQQLLLRGTYLTSATQEGTPLDRVLGKLSNDLGIAPSALKGSYTTGKSFFVRDVFEKLIFQEAFLAGPNSKLERSRRWLLGFTYSAAIAVLALAVFAWSTSFTRNKLFIESVKNDLAKLEESFSLTPLRPSNHEAVNRRLNDIYAFKTVYGQAFPEGAPMTLGLGLYQGDRITAAGEKLYRHNLEQLLLPVVALGMANTLSSGLDNTDDFYNTLKSYLMMGDRTKRDFELLRTWANDFWSNLFSNKPRVHGQLLEHLDRLFASDFANLKLDQPLLERSRDALNARPLANLLYANLKQEFNPLSVGEFNVPGVVGRQDAEIFTFANGKAIEWSVSNLFTRYGYTEVFKDHIKNLAQQAKQEAWVLNDEKVELTDAEVTNLEKQLKKLYFAEYIDLWSDFIANLRIKSFSSLQEATDILNALTHSASPARTLLDAIHQNVHLTESGMMDKLQQRLPDKLEELAKSLFDSSDSENRELKEHPEIIVDKHFKAFNTAFEQAENGTREVDKIFDLMEELYVYIDGLANGVNVDLAAIARGRETTDAVTRLRFEAKRQPAPINQWLNQLASYSRKATYSGANRQVNNIWAAEYLPLCKHFSQGRYPLNRDSNQEISLSDFTRLFGPNGILDTFFSEHLRPFVDFNGGRWLWRKDGAVSLGFSNSTLVQFRRAERIKDMFFTPPENQLRVDFRLKTYYLDANTRGVGLDIDGQRFSYRHGPVRSKAASWPGPSPGLVQLSYDDNSGLPLAQRIEGEWAFFRLLDSTRLSRANGQNLNFSIELQGRRSSWSLTPASVINPFSSNDLRRFQCPRQL